MDAWAVSTTSTGHEAVVSSVAWTAELYVPLSLAATWMDTMPSAPSPTRS